MKYSLDELSWALILALEQSGVQFDYNMVQINQDENARENKAADYFWSKHISFDTKFESESRAGDEPAWVADNGQGVESLVTEIDAAGESNWYAKRAAQAYQFVYYRDKKLCTVLNLVLKNGKNRKESICQLAKKRFMLRK